MKNILIFNDISGLGNCSLAANLPIFTKLSHYCMPVVTATFSCQTGFENYTFQKNQNLSQCVADVISHRAPQAVYVGFCVDENLLEEVTCAVQQNRDKAFVFVDPVLGDNGKLYGIFNQNYVEKMKKLVSLAHCISPNLTEACLLAEVDFESLQAQSSEPTFLAICGKRFENFLQVTGAKSAVITGVECGDFVGNIVLEKGQPTKFVTNARVPVNYSGTGDAFSSVLLGELLNGCSLVRATEVAANFISKAASATQCNDRRFGVEFSKVLEIL